MKAAWEAAENLIVRPPRCRYQMGHLGPARFAVKGFRCERKDVEVKNSRDLTLQVSIFQPVESDRKALPCVVYCHGNCGSRLDALRSAELLLPYNFRVIAFDFAGCGHSDGETISLGFYEKFDIEAVVNYLRTNRVSSTIALWGRSMGAASSLMYSHMDPSIAGMVLDSPFTSLNDLMPEVVANSKLKIPGFMVKIGAKILAKSIKKRAQFDIGDVNPISVCASAFIPALFAHGRDDDFVLPHHSKRLHDAYAGEKDYIEMEGDHNQERPEFFHEKCSIFLHNALLNAGAAQAFPDDHHGPAPNLATLDGGSRPIQARRPLSTGVQGVVYDGSPAAASPGDMGMSRGSVHNDNFQLEGEMSEEEMLQKALLLSAMEAKQQQAPSNQSSKKSSRTRNAPRGNVAPCDVSAGDSDSDDELKMAIKLSLQSGKASSSSQQNKPSQSTKQSKQAQSRPQQQWPRASPPRSRGSSTSGQPPTRGAPPGGDAPEQTSIHLMNWQGEEATRSNAGSSPALQRNLANYGNRPRNPSITQSPPNTEFI